MQNLATLWRSARWLAGIASFLVLTACSGGGGGGGDSNTGDGFTISATSLSFSAQQFATLPPVQDIQATVTHPEAYYVGAAYQSGVTPATWLDVQVTGSGSAWTFHFSVNTTGLSPGTYTATISLGIARSDQSVITYKNVTVNYTIAAKLTASPSSLNFTHVIGNPVPPNTLINIGGAGTSWTATANQNWVILSSPTGVAPGNLGVGFNPTGLGAGTYNATLTITPTGAGQPVTVGISLVVEVPILRAAQTSLSFSGINGATLPSQTLDIFMNNGAMVGWTAVSGANWLVLDKNSGTTPDRLTVSVNPAIPKLASGTYNSTITLSGSYGGSTLNQIINVSLTLSPATLTVNPNSVTLGGSTGRNFNPVPVQLSLNTGSNAYPWNVTLNSGGDNWLSASVSSGSVSVSPVSVSLDSLRDNVTSGTHNGTANFSATVNGDVIITSIPVTLNVESHKLLVADNGVALTSMPTLSKLTHTVQVTDNLGAATGWSATSNQPWLSVTSSGTTPGNLVLTANPAGLAPDTVHYATVSISSSDTSVENTETVRVGLWVGSDAPSATTSINVKYFQVVSDPIRPYAYVNDHGTDLTVYNVYTGAVVGSITNVAARLGQMTISNDGSQLFAVDVTNRRIVPVNLDTWSTMSSWSLSTDIIPSSDPSVEYARTNGVGIVVAGDFNIYRVSTGTAFSFPTPLIYYVSILTTSLDGKRFCAGNTGVSGESFACYSLDYTSLNGGQLLVNKLRESGYGGNGQDLALSNDGSRLYVASGAPYSFGVFDTTSFSLVQQLPGAPYPNNVEIGPDGRIFCGADSAYGPTDVWIYNTAGFLLSSYYLSGGSLNILARQLAVSGDGLRMMALVDYPTTSGFSFLIFTTVGP